ncbi:hypothetical protein G6F23_015362 [Rhizopus arrhizus]|nr:hypothetical protein G6F23_015362 [Rhizopus arrhizus]
MLAAEQAVEHREGGSRAQQVGQQEQVQHAVALGRHDHDRDGQQQHRPAGQPLHVHAVGVGHQATHVYGDDAGHRADRRVGQLGRASWME